MSSTYPRRAYHQNDSATSLLSASSERNSLRESWQSESPYSAASSKMSTISGKFSLSPDPQSWGTNLSPDYPEPDDALHNPDVRGGKIVDYTGSAFTARGFANVGCLVVLCAGLLALFVGYPVIHYVQHHNTSAATTSQNTTSPLPAKLPNISTFSLIDVDTPTDAYTIPGFYNGTEMQLVFSDEFETEGRTFYPGDDPYWEAVNLHYWATNNLEWYDPAAITTSNGSLVITYSEKQTHNLSYQGGMMSTWNKFCFTGGMILVSVVLPDANNIAGMWPAVWTMGNLGRAGYGASLEGMWPYTYDACDVGTGPNQTHNGLPSAALTTGSQNAPYDGALSYLPGQRLSRCTCPGQSHPGPTHSDGTYVGRSAPEIDIFEGQITGTPLAGQVSQSGQWAPFNAAYLWNTTGNMIIPDPTISVENGYIGGDTQQATSVVTQTNQDCYELTGNCYSVYGFEYTPGYDDNYVSWIADNTLAWTLIATGMGPDNQTQISARPIPQEPLYILMNLGMSYNFGNVDLEHLTFPNHMKVDYVRVYQPADRINIGCDPKDFPTADYINTYIEAYSNPNLTTWVHDYGQPFPKNSYYETC